MNISQECVAIYNKFCSICQAKHQRIARIGLVTKPIRSHQLFERAQIHLIDMQSLPDKDFKWILNYQDHFTKFNILR
jgi:hypothetical protein